MGIKSYTDEELQEAVKIAKSLSHLARLLGLGGYNTISGGGGSTTIRTLTKQILLLHLNTSHFIIPISIDPLMAQVKKPTIKGTMEQKHALLLKYVLLPNSCFSLRKYRSLLIEVGILQDWCAGCERKTHVCYGETRLLRLEIDHIDGDHYNNSPSNLRHLCPCCHSFQNTDSGLHKARGRKKLTQEELRSIRPVSMLLKGRGELKEQDVCMALAQWADDGGLV